MKFLPAAAFVSALAFGGVAAAQAPATPPAAAAAAAPQSAEAFLAANAKLPGVKTLPSGLQYKVIKSGPPGPSPKEGDAIKVHYEGKLADGTTFDSTFGAKPMLAPLDGLVPGWMEAIPLMHVGDEWTLYIPPSLGYGERGAGPIPPNSALVFRIQLLGMLSAD